MNWLLSLIDVSAVAANVPAEQTLFDFYASNLRASLFSGFLTLTGFLFSVKTFLIVNLKKEVYENAKYKQRVSERRQLNKAITTFGPLRRFSNLLLATIIASLTTSVSQLTIGIIHSNISAIVCLTFAVATIILLSICLFVSAKNLSDWFGFLEAESVETEGKSPN